MSSVLSTIRAVRPADRDALGRFFVQNDVADVTRFFHPFPLTAATAATLCERPTRDLYRVAFVGDLLVGFYMLRGWDEGYDVPSFGVLVDREWTGRGFGRALTLAAIEDSRRLGCRTLRLTVHADNLPAASLYEALGFIRTGQTTQHDTIVMLLEL